MFASLLRQNSYILYNNKNKTFCHVISDIITDTINNNQNKGYNYKISKNILIPRRIVFLVDKSESMYGDNWNKWNKCISNLN